MKQFFVMCVVCAIGVLPSFEGMAQKYNPEESGFTLPAENRWGWINGTFTGDRILIRPQYKNMNPSTFGDSIAGTANVSNIGDVICLFLGQIFYWGYRGDAGFDTYLARENMWDIIESRKILEESREVTISQNLLRQNPPNIFVWVYDNFQSPKKLKLIDLLGQKVLMYKGKIILLLANGSPVGMNNPLFDKENPKKAGYQDVQSGKMMSGQSREVPYVAREPKTPDLVVSEDDYPKPETPLGERGQDGTNGKDGNNGRDGKDGVHGERGQDGTNGRDGVTGVRGPQGLPGSPGKDGAVGPRGEMGTQGVSGSRGERGEAGPPGDIGSQGIQGPQGPQGTPGRNGERGATGPQGPRVLPAEVQRVVEQEVERQLGGKPDVINVNIKLVRANSSQKDEKVLTETERLRKENESLRQELLKAFEEEKLRRENEELKREKEYFERQYPEKDAQSKPLQRPVPSQPPAQQQQSQPQQRGTGVWLLPSDMFRAKGMYD